MFKFLTYLLVIGIIYRVITRFFFPVANISKQANDRLKQMQDQINEMNRRKAEPTVQKKTSGKKGDYIDYEEVG